MKQVAQQRESASNEFCSSLDVQDILLTQLNRQTWQTSSSTALHYVMSTQVLKKVPLQITLVTAQKYVEKTKLFQKTYL